MQGATNPTTSRIVLRGSLALAALLSCAPAPTSSATDSTEPAADGVAVADVSDAVSWGCVVTATDVSDAGAELDAPHLSGGRG